MSYDARNSKNGRKDDDDNNDDDEHGMLMPGFRFHPTEEELIEFYLRRKVEGKPFNIELITFLDLYRYDPWELPVMAAIGEKEWYFYVPRERKYRNGDRPNRVTTSGYWKATGADRLIFPADDHHHHDHMNSSSNSIGLKKTLVFYSGKAPKGIRTSWVMNEYRLPHHETQRCQQGAEISVCRVYKRAGVEDRPSLPRYLIPAASTSKKQRKHDARVQLYDQKLQSFNIGGSSGQPDRQINGDLQDRLVNNYQQTWNISTSQQLQYNYSNHGQIFSTTVPPQLQSPALNDTLIPTLHDGSFPVTTALSISDHRVYWPEYYWISPETNQDHEYNTLK